MSTECPGVASEVGCIVDRPCRSYEFLQNGANKSQQQGGAQKLCKQGDLHTHFDAHMRCLKGKYWVHAAAAVQKFTGRSCKPAGHKPCTALVHQIRVEVCQLIGEYICAIYLPSVLQRSVKLKISGNAVLYMSNGMLMSALISKGAPMLRRAPHSLPGDVNHTLEC